MKKFYFFLLTVCLIMSFSCAAFAADEMVISCSQADIDAVNGVIAEEQQESIQQLLDSYFYARALDFHEGASDTWGVLRSQLSETVYQDELLRLEAILPWKTECGVIPTDVQYQYTVEEAVLINNVLQLTVYERLDIVYGPTEMDVMGFGTKHEMHIALSKDASIVTDSYSEDDLWGFMSSSYAGSQLEQDRAAAYALELEGEADAESTQIGAAMPMLAAARATSGINYDSDAAVRYADQYALNYNSKWPNFNSVGGDCANFVSQCLYAGGLPMDSSWYCYSNNNYKNWASSTGLRNYLMNSGIGIREFTPTKASDFEKGMPIFWDTDGYGVGNPSNTWYHSEICVGFNSSSVPIYDAHNTDRYHMPMYASNYKYCRCVQMPGGFLLPGTPVLKNMQSQYSSMLGVDFNWDSVSNAVRYALIIDRWDSASQTYVRHWEHWWTESGVHVDLEEGAYRAYVRAASQNGNDLYWGDGEISTFTVYKDTVTPGKPTLKDMKTSYNANEGITFNWDATVNTTNYGLRISKWNESTSGWDRIVTNWYAESGVHYDLEAGTYLITFQSINATADGWVSNFDEEYTITVYTPEPGTTNLEDMRTSYTDVEGITFNWKPAENAVRYALIIDRLNATNQTYERYWENWWTESNVHLDLEQGSYRAYVRCASGSGDALKWSGEGVISYFTVTKDMVNPGRPALKNMTASYDVSTGVYFQWDETVNTTNYGLLIDQWDDTQNDFVRYISNWYAESGIHYDLPAGKYRVAMQSINNSNSDWLYSQSDPYWTEFEVVITAPKQVTLTDLEESYAVSDGVTFFWNYPDEYTTRYALIVSRLDEVSQTYVEYYSDLWAESGEQMKLPAGSYKAELKSANGMDEDWLWSAPDVQYFTVIDNNPPQNDVINFMVGSGVLTKSGTAVTEISMTNNPGAAVFNAEVVYDPDVVTPVAVTKGALLTGTLTSNISDVETAKKLYITCWSQNGENIVEDGNLFNIEWKVADTFAEPTGSSSISLLFADDGICDSENNLLASSVTAGEIQVQSYLVGDIYIDNAINMKDLLYLARYMNKQETLTTQQFYAADLDGNGKVNAIDVLQLVKRLSSGAVTRTTGDFISNGMLKGNGKEVLANDTYEIVIGDVALDANGDAEVEIQGKNCPGIAAFRFVLSVPEGCTVNDVTPSEILQRGNFEYNKDSNIMYWYTTNNQVLDGTLFTVKLHSDSAQADLDLNYDPEDISDEQYNTIPITITKTQSVSTGSTISGTITSYGDDNAETIICLLQDGAEVYTTTGTDGYFIVNVVAGTYIMEVMKQNHVTREYTVTIDTSNVTQDVKIHLLGDIDGNGEVTTMDYMRVNSHAKGIALLTDYALKCADVVGTDGKVTTMDAMRINAHAKGTAKLW